MAATSDLELRHIGDKQAQLINWIEKLLLQVQGGSLEGQCIAHDDLARAFARYYGHGVVDNVAYLPEAIAQLHHFQR